MINGMQFVMHLPTANIEMPGNGFLVLKQLIMVATFDIPKVEMSSIQAYKTAEGEILYDAPLNVVSGMD